MPVFDSEITKTICDIIQQHGKHPNPDNLEDSISLEGALINAGLAGLDIEITLRPNKAGTGDLTVIHDE